MNPPAMTLEGKLVSSPIFFPFMLGAFSATFAHGGKKMEARLNHFPATGKRASQLPLIVLIPGGGGFSGASWGPTEHLQRTFDVVTVDPPGTGGLKRYPSYSYEGIISAIETELNNLTRPIVLSGISFGCVYAADLATRGKYKVAGYVGFAGLVSPSAFQALEQPNPYISEEMQNADKEFMAKPNDKTWNNLLEKLVPIYFSPTFHDSGRRLLLGDKSEYKSYLDVFFPYFMGELGTGVADRLKAFGGTKVMVASENDRLVFPALIESDAKKLGAKFEKITGGSHFVLFEEPEATAKLYAKYFSLVK